MLDKRSREAARELAHSLKCSVSDAIRQAIVRQRDLILGVPQDVRDHRVTALHQLFDLFEDHDVDEELERLADEREHF